MSAKRKGLGRGLDALLGIPGSDGEHSEAGAPRGESEDGTLKHLPIEFLQRGKYQPRRDMHPEALQELAESIRSQGIMQPIVVRPLGPNSYEIIAGERRWRAAQRAGLDKVPTLVRDVPDQAAIASASSGAMSTTASRISSERTSTPSRKPTPSPASSRNFTSPNSRWRRRWANPVRR